MTQRKMDKHIMTYRKLNIMTHAIGQKDRLTQLRTDRLKKRSGNGGI